MGNLITVYSTLCCALPWLTALEQAEADGDKLDFFGPHRRHQSSVHSALSVGPKIC